MTDCCSAISAEKIESRRGEFGAVFGTRSSRKTQTGIKTIENLIGTPDIIVADDHGEIEAATRKVSKARTINVCASTWGGLTKAIATTRSHFRDRSPSTASKMRPPCYIPSTDVVNMPAYSDFIETDGLSGEVHWASTMFHELSRATGHPARLNSSMDRNEYAREECVAELSAAFLSSRFSNDYSDAGSPAYLEHWLKVLKEDSKALFVIATQASRAADWLIEHYQPKELAAE